MTWTHVYICGRWVWRWLSPSQWAVLPHIGKYALVGKTPHIIAGAVGAVCAAGVGGVVLLPPLIYSPIATEGARAFHGPIVAGSPRTAVPEPGSLLVFGVGLAALAAVRRKS